VLILNYEKAQRLFLKLCFIFKQANLNIHVPSGRSEAVQLLFPLALQSGGNNSHVGTIQYGGVKYPFSDKNQLRFTYVELRLKGEFLKEINKYDEVFQLLKEKDANNWLKYKFVNSSDDIQLAKKVRNHIVQACEKKYELDYWHMGIDTDILQLPRDKNDPPITYDQKDAISIVSDLLIKRGYNISRTSTSHPTHHLVAEANNLTAKIRVKQLQFDSAYKNSPLPYQVYKIDAFESEADQTKGKNDVDFVVGYNFKDKSFACLSIKQFTIQRSKVVHQREGQNHEYYQSWSILDEFLREGAFK
jgi:hypothetical protein